MEKNEVEDTGVMRTFGSGATRDTATDKPEFGGFLSPMVLRAFGEYMHKNRKQADGSLRASDNWKKGIPRRVYIESLLRHVVDVWGYITGDDSRDITYDEVLDALLAVIFNAQGLAREIIIGRDTGSPPVEIGVPPLSDEIQRAEKIKEDLFSQIFPDICDRYSPREGCDNCEIEPLTPGDDVAE